MPIATKAETGACIYVDDQEKALRFYTSVLGFVKKADFSQGSYRAAADRCTRWR